MGEPEDFQAEDRAWSGRRCEVRGGGIPEEKWVFGGAPHHCKQWGMANLPARDLGTASRFTSRY